MPSIVWAQTLETPSPIDRHPSAGWDPGPSDTKSNVTASNAGDSSLRWNDGVNKIPKYPVIFVVGLGDPGNAAWRDFAERLWPGLTAKHLEGTLWAQVKNDSGPPEVVLKKIEEVVQALQQRYFDAYRPAGVAQASDVKLILYGRSYGAVLVRDYLSDHLNNHHVAGVLMEAGPHQGAEVTRLAVIPQALTWGGAGAALATGQVALGLYAVVGLAIPWIADNVMGLNLEAGGLYALRPGSPYLQDLSKRVLPTDIRYINVVENCAESQAILLNLFELNVTAADGGISVHSQTLSPSVVPNFDQLKLKQVSGSVFHWTIPEESLETVGPLLYELEGETSK